MDGSLPVGGQAMEISSTEDHPVPGETGVARQEAQSGLLQSVLHLSWVREEVGVALTGEVADVLRPRPVITAPVWLAN